MISSSGHVLFEGDREDVIRPRVQNVAKMAVAKKSFCASFDWQSVNEAIPESLFGYEEFDPNPPDIVNVVDYSFGRRIVLKPRGVPLKQKSMKPELSRNSYQLPREVPLKQKSMKPGLSRNSYQLLLISLVGILALFIWLRASKSKNSD